MEHGDLRNRVPATGSELTHQIQFPHSLGLLYSAFTYYCGFKVNSGEYKLMGLAPYGRPIYQDVILKHLIDLKPDGSFWLNMDYFNYCQGLTMTNGRFHRLFGGPPRASGITARAAAHGPGGQHPGGHRRGHAPDRPAPPARRPGCNNLVLAGGVALNCVANGRLLREGPSTTIWIQPAAGDAGGALGAALFVWHQLLENPRHLPGARHSEREFAGTQASATSEIERFLNGAARSYQRFTDEADLHDHIVDCWPTGRWSAGSRAAWSSAHVPWEPGASWAIPVRRECRPP